MFFAVAGAMFLPASTAYAEAIWTVEVSTDAPGGLSVVTIGDQIILDITLRTTDRALAIAGSVNGYDNTVLSLNAGASRISHDVLTSACFPSFGCIQGLVNQVPSPIPFQENAVGPGVEAEVLATLGVTAAEGNGSIDPGIVTGVPGDAQFRVVFTMAAPGTTTLFIGTYAEYLDGYTGTEDNLVTNASVTITTTDGPVVPEPGTALLVGLGLAVLGSRKGQRT